MKIVGKCKILRKKYPFKTFCQREISCMISGLNNPIKNPLNTKLFKEVLSVNITIFLEKKTWQFFNLYFFFSLRDLDVISLEDLYLVLKTPSFFLINTVFTSLLLGWRVSLGNSQKVCPDRGFDVGESNPPNLLPNQHTHKHEEVDQCTNRLGSPQR